VLRCNNWIPLLPQHMIEIEVGDHKKSQNGNLALRQHRAHSQWVCSAKYQSHSLSSRIQLHCFLALTLSVITFFYLCFRSQLHTLHMTHDLIPLSLFSLLIFYLIFSHGTRQQGKLDYCLSQQGTTHILHKFLDPQLVIQLVQVILAQVLYGTPDTWSIPIQEGFCRPSTGSPSTGRSPK